MCPVGRIFPTGNAKDGGHPLGREQMFRLGAHRALPVRSQAPGGAIPGRRRRPHRRFPLPAQLPVASSQWRCRGESFSPSPPPCLFAHSPLPCPSVSSLSSERMDLVQLIVPSESAHETVYELGKVRPIDIDRLRVREAPFDELPPPLPSSQGGDLSSMSDAFPRSPAPRRWACCSLRTSTPISRPSSAPTSTRRAGGEGDRGGVWWLERGGGGTGDGGAFRNWGSLSPPSPIPPRHCLSTFRRRALLWRFSPSAVARRPRFSGDSRGSPPGTPHRCLR